MCAPATELKEGVIEEDLKTFSAQAGSTFWDEPTVVAREELHRAKMQNEEELSMIKSHDTSPPAKNRIEKFTCLYPGCSRKFINQAELRNHVEIFHQTDEEAFENPDLPYSSGAVEEQDIGIAGTVDSRHDTHQQFAEFDADKTVKPVRITAAALEALNLNADLKPARPIDQGSVMGSDIHHSSVSSMSVDTTYSVLDTVEDDAFSDVARPNDASVLLPVRILLTLWAKLLGEFLARHKAAYTQHGPYQGTHDQRRSASQSRENVAESPYASSSASITSSSRASKKRDRPDDDEEGNRRKPPKRQSQGQLSPEHKPLACPFNKFDSFIFGGDANNKDYYICSTWHDVKTAYLKQHLVRNHCLPMHHCPRCGQDCKNESDLRAHARLVTPCKVVELDSQKLMPEVQQELGLRSRNAVATERTAYWYKVYDTIFGHDARARRPVEPYYKGPSQEVLESFLHFSELRMPQVLRESRQKLQLDPEDYNEQNAELVRTVLQEASQRFMDERRAAQPQSLKDIRQQNTVGSVADDLGERTVIVQSKQQAVEDQRTTEGPETAPHLWTPGFDLPQQSNMAPFHQRPPHAAHYTQGQFYSLPTRNAEPALPQQQEGANDYDQSTNFSYSSLTPESFSALFDNPEIMAAIEDPDMYGGHSVDPDNLDSYAYHEPTSKREP